MPKRSGESGRDLEVRPAARADAGDDVEDRPRAFSSVPPKRSSRWLISALRNWQRM